MNARLLRMARRDSRGSRIWTVAGFPHSFKAFRGGIWGPDVLAVSWPDTDRRGETVRRTARFDWHGRLASRQIRSVLAGNGGEA